jgi:hypothetical protein
MPCEDQHAIYGPRIEQRFPPSETSAELQPAQTSRLLGFSRPAFAPPSSRRLHYD